MGGFLELWAESASTTLGLFWVAFWAFGLGYLISSMIQVFVTRERMKRSMGGADARSVALGTFFGFISSSCSFAALSTTRALFAKGAGMMPSLAFLLASTNLVIELGIIIAVFLSWQFVVGEYIGGLLLIGLTWLLVKLTLTKRLERQARENAREKTGGAGDDEIPNWKRLMLSREGWARVAHRYVMEWQMVWKDVTFGFTIAGVIAAFVPRSFFQALFPGAGDPDASFWQILAQVLVGPIAAFFTFIGSMGNIPLAAVLFGNGVSFAGVMAFIFSDLVVFPVLRIQARYYGWKVALYILAVFLAALAGSALILHYGFAAFGQLPDIGVARQVTDREFFAIDYTLFFNIAFIGLSGVFVWWNLRRGKAMTMGSERLSERALFALAIASLVWLAGGVIVRMLL